MSTFTTVSASATTTASEMRCTYCHQYGHDEEFCTYNNNSPNFVERRCDHCKGVLHDTKDCHIQKKILAAKRIQDETLAYNANMTEEERKQQEITYNEFMDEIDAAEAVNNKKYGKSKEFKPVPLAGWVRGIDSKTLNNVVLFQTHEAWELLKHKPAEEEKVNGPLITAHNAFSWPEAVVFANQFFGQYFAEYKFKIQERIPRDVQSQKDRRDRRANKYVSMYVKPMLLTYFQEIRRQYQREKNAEEARKREMVEEAERREIQRIREDAKHKKAEGEEELVAAATAVVSHADLRAGLEGLDENEWD